MLSISAANHHCPLLENQRTLWLVCGKSSMSRDDDDVYKVID